MKKWVILIIILVVLIILPPIGILLIVGFLIYKFYPRFKINSRNNFKKLEAYIKSLIMSDIKKINLKEDIEVFEVSKHIYMTKKGSKHILFCALSSQKTNEIDSRMLSEIDGVYLFRSKDELSVIVVQEFLAFKLSETILKAEMLKLLNKTDIIISVLAAKCSDIKLVDPKLIAW